MEEWLATTGGRVAVLIIGALFIAVVANMVLRRRRETEWESLARDLGLTFLVDDSGPRVTGTLNNRTIELSLVAESSDGGSGVAETQIRVGLAGVPEGMVAEATPDVWSGVVNQSLEAVQTGNEEFDQNVLLTGVDAATAQAYWTEARQQTFLSLVRHQEEYDQLTVQSGNLTARFREVLSDHIRLESVIRHLVETAAALEAGSLSQNGVS